MWHKCYKGEAQERCGHGSEKQALNVSRRQDANNLKDNCMDNSNNKPWVTKALLNVKKRAFRSGDQAELEHVQRDLKHSTREGKDNYRRKLEYHLENKNTRDVWRGMREITGFHRKGGGTAEGRVQ